MAHQASPVRDAMYGSIPPALVSHKKKPRKTTFISFAATASVVKKIRRSPRSQA